MDKNYEHEREEKRDELERLLEWKRIEEEKSEQAEKECLEVFKKYYPKGGIHGSSAAKVLAKLIEYFDFEDTSYDMVQLYLKWTLSYYINNKVKIQIPNIDQLHNDLVRLKCNEDNPFIYNDLDCSVFYLVNSKELKVIGVTSQNVNYIFIRTFDYLEDKLYEDTLHVYRYWDKIEDTWEYSDYEDEDNDIKKEGIIKAIQKADWYNENYSDVYPDNEFIHRPNLEWFKKNNFASSYGDCRDAGFVTFYSSSISNTTEHIFLYLSHIETAFFYLRCSIEAISKPPE